MAEKTKLKMFPLCKRIVLLCLGLLVMAFGVAFSIKAALGTSPISSVPYVTGAISGLSVGTTTIIMNTLMTVIPDDMKLATALDIISRMVSTSLV